jgi:hypothetical protein
MFWTVSGTSAATLRALFASPHLGKLTKLDLYGSRADNAVAADIADGRFPNIADLVLASNAIGDGGGLALANSPHLGNIRLLDLRYNPIQDGSVRLALRRRFGKALTI